MSWTSSIDTGAVVDAVSSSSSSWASTAWDTASKFATDAFDWMEKNPEATNALGGVASGLGSAYMANKEIEAQKEEARKNRAFEREMYDKRKEDRQVKPGSIQGYGSHVNNISKGLITNGMISDDEKY